MSSDANSAFMPSLGGSLPSALARLRAEVLAVNRELPQSGLVTLTWGNASAMDRELGLIVIKPSGVAYEQLTIDDLVVLELDGTIVHGTARPSSDTPTHLALYRAFPTIGAVVHTHSSWATAWAQAEREIPVLGTTHADLSPHPIPLTRALTDHEIETDYETATGQALIEAITPHGPSEQPCALARQHGPFCWGPDPQTALTTAITLEQIAKLAAITTQLTPHPTSLQTTLLHKHHQRKHGPNAYYGQPPPNT
jgi:L-ribulose-5-phosphate 4-epimerase